MAPQEKRAWYDDAKLHSVKSAGHLRPRPHLIPLRKIDGSDQQPD